MGEFENLPSWKKVLVALFAVLMPFLGSLHSVAF